MIRDAGRLKHCRRLTTTDDVVFIFPCSTDFNVKAAQCRSALGHVNELSDLWRRVQILSINETPYQMT